MTQPLAPPLAPALTLPVREDQCLDKSLSSLALALPPHPHRIPVMRLTCGDWEHLSTLDCYPPYLYLAEEENLLRCQARLV